MGADLVNWLELIVEARADAGDSDGPLIACTLSDAELLRKFDCGYGGTEGSAFTAWTERRVYFPTCYDGAEGVGSAPRHPCDEATLHQGGG